MVFIITYLIFGIFFVICAMQASYSGNYEELKTIAEILTDWYSIQNLLIAFGTIAICDKINNLKEKNNGVQKP